MKLCPKCNKHFPDDANFCPVDAGRLEVVQDEPGGAGGEELGGRFALGERLAGQRTGEVYEASDKQGDAPCVVKLVDPKVFPTPLLLQRTERELKQLERLDSAGVAKVLDHGKRDGKLWVATQRVDGRPLDQVIAGDGPMAPDRAARIVHAVGQALAEAAKLGVIHRDLAPKNLLVGEGDQIKVINFGVAVPATDKIQGVPEFVAPEQIEGKPVDQRSNIYSLGALYYFMLTGEPPYTGDVATVHESHLAGNPPEVSAKVEVSDHVTALVLKALARSSSKRFMTLRQLLGQLEGIIDGSEPGETQPLGRVGSATTPGTGKARGKAKDAALGGTLLGMSALPDSDQDRRDHSATIPMDGPPRHDSPAAEVPEKTAEMAEPPVEPQTIPKAAQPDLAPSVTNAAPAGKVRTEVDDNAATTKMEAHRDPVPVDDDTAPAPILEQRIQPRAASQSGGPASGKARKKKKKKKSKGKFRETMWFKKGELDEAAAEAAAQTKDNLASDKADEIPMEDRYADDGTLSSQDQERLSLRTGSTQMSMEAVGDRPGRKATEVSEEELLREMSGGRTKLALLVGGAVLVVVVIIIIAAVN